MNEVEFPRRVGIASIKPRLMGMRFQPFTNIDGETFAKPSLGGFWQFEVVLNTLSERGMLAMSGFITAMRGHGVTLLPLSNQWVPNDDTGRRLTAFLQSPEWTADHVGFMAAPFDGFTLLAAGFQRDSYIDVVKPALSQIWPGHYITLGERLHQVTAVSALNEDETEVRLTISPGLRANYDPGEIVIVDYLVCKCVMQDAGEPVLHSNAQQQISATFIEAF